MNLRINQVSTFLKLAFCALVAMSFMPQVSAADAKADGTWTWTTPGRNNGPERKYSLKLKTEGSKLTGKISSPGRDGAVTETEIKDGTIKGDEVAFKVEREFNNNKMVIKYNGKIAGDTIKGKSEFDRNGEAQSRDWEAKRKTDTK